jgi:ABC-type Zn uptake system ZnuABC Zn-binding protein ZnuA
VRRLSSIASSLLLLLAGLLASLPLAGCRSGPRERLTVAVSMFPLDDLVRRIAGSDADVVLVLSQGASLEGSAPPMDAPARVRAARLLVSVGLGLDPWMEGLLQSAAPKAHLLKLGDRVPTIANADGSINGYVWMDPQRARLMATAIAEDLARADVSHANAFRDRASALDASLATLDAEIEARTAAWKTHELASLPSTFAYYAERYGLRASSPAVPPALAGATANARTYEDLIRGATAALEPNPR